MKWFCHIFSLYFMILCCLPCSDGEHTHGAVSDNSNVTYLSSQGNSHSHEGCHDACSPFCGCHCCTTYYTFRPFAPMAFAPLNPAGKKTIFPDDSCLVINVAFAIEHPPQLV